MARIGDKTVTFCDRASGPLSCASAPQARRTRPVRVRSAHVASHESHRRALELQRAAVRGALPWAQLVHPSATLECEHRRRPVMAAMACGLQPHPGGARHAARRYHNDQTGTAPTHRPTRLHTAESDRRLRSVCGRSLSATAFQPPYDPCNVAWLGDDLQQSSSLPCAPCAPRRCACSADSAVPEVRRVLNLDPMLCGVVVELDRLSTGLGRLWGGSEQR